MTDKQIIIDGVDVSECDFLAKKDDYCSYSGVTYAYKGQCMCSDEEMCKEHPKCFYKKVLKQLKAKEQECERLNTKLLNLLGKEGLRQSEKEFYEGQLNQLKAENDKLKNTLNSVKNSLEIIKKVDGNSFDEVLTNEFEYMLQKISEVENVV